MEVDQPHVAQSSTVPDSRPSSPEPEEVGEDELSIDHSRDPIPPSPPRENGDAGPSTTRGGSDDDLNSAGTNSDIDMDDWEARMQAVTGLEMDIPVKVNRSKRLSKGSAGSTSSRRSSIRAEPAVSSRDKGKGRERDRRGSAASNASSRKRGNSIIQSSRRTPEDSGESSGVEVTSARSKPRYKLRSRSPSRTPLEDRAEGTSKGVIKAAPIGKGKAPGRPTSTRRTRSTTAEENAEEDLPPIQTHIQAVKAEFVPLSTATEGFDADDIIAQLRAQTMARLGQVPTTAKPDVGLDSGTAQIVTAMDEDSDDDDLADPSLLLKASTIRTAKPAETETKKASTQGLPAKVEPKKAHIRLPGDKSKYSLASMAKARLAESSRGWSGIGSAADIGEEQETSMLDGDQYSGQYDSDGSSDLPDVSHASTKGTRERRASDGAMKRVAGALGAQDDALKAVQTAREDLAELDRKKQKEEAAERRRFWEADFDMLIEVSSVHLQRSIQWLRS